MAESSLYLTAEFDLVQDSIDDCERILRALARRHGDRYRSLERRIENLMDGEVSSPKMHWIGGGRILVEPFPEVQSIIRDARELGVI